MQFNLKRFLVFFAVVMGGSIGGAYVNSWLGIGEGTGWIAYAFYMFMPVLVIYILWEWWASKKVKA